MATIIKPIGDKLLVKTQAEGQKVTQLGILLPETANDKPRIGHVVSVGAGRILENGTVMPLTVKAGDKILFRKFAGTEIKIDDNPDDLLLITERDILGIITKTEDGEAE